jgi:phosphate transport system ATP-binding protein
MTAAENVMLGIHEAAPEVWRWPSGTRGGENLVDLFLRPGETARVERETRARAMELLRLVGLTGVAETQAGALSFGQQKLVSFARLLGTDADVLLLDEPASALDPVATASIEELLHRLKHRYTIVIVTHNMQQAARVADRTAFFSLDTNERVGTLVEYADTDTIFSNPADPRTRDYVTGRFG